LYVNSPNPREKRVGGDCHKITTKPLTMSTFKRVNRCIIRVRVVCRVVTVRFYGLLSLLFGLYHVLNA
jgi:hypothetical protein